MSRELQPGDVALVTFLAKPDGEKFGRPGNYLEPGRHLAIAEPALPGEEGVMWRSIAGGSAHENRRDCIARISPVVVIDPADADQVARLLDAWETWSGRVPYSDMAEPGDLTAAEAMREALLAFRAGIEKPDEPKELGALVRVADGRRFFRWSYDVHTHQPWRDVGAVHTDTEDDQRWDDLDVVAVLSDGWPA